MRLRLVSEGHMRRDAIVAFVHIRKTLACFEHGARYIGSSLMMIAEIYYKFKQSSLSIFYTCHVGRSSIASGLRSQLLGGLGGPKRAQKVLEEKWSCIGYFKILLEI